MMKQKPILWGGICILQLSGVTDAEEATKGLRREVWTNIEGSGLWHLQRSEAFYRKAQIIEIIDGAEAPSDFGNHYGQRLRGFLTPKQSGEFTFWISGDDNCELWLSTDDNKFNKQRIAGISGFGKGHQTDFAGVKEWDKFSSQKSRPITLEAGKRYFIEALHKEGGGADHLAIAWTRPGKIKPKVIPSRVLSPYGEDSYDADQDELPDTWESQFGLSSSDNGDGEPMHGPLGDSDGDGWLNWEECLSGSDPTKADIQEGCLQQEIWYGLWGQSVSELFASNNFHLPPDKRGLIRSCSVIETQGQDQYGMRLRGYITPEVSGDYRFWICGDDNCEFLLSSDESKFNLNRIAWIERTKDSSGFTQLGEWDKYESQKSALVTLEAGKRYFLEVLQKDDRHEGHVAFNWSLPGSDERLPVPKEVLSSYMPTAEDADDDGLPVEWETEHGFDPNSTIGKDGALGDPDNDLLPNWFEFDQRTDPNVFNNLEGGFSEEVWWEINGHFVKDLTEAPKFLRGSDYMGLRLGALCASSPGDHYGMRLRATLKAPVSGEYTFWISSDNHSELWLSDDDRKFHKNRIAWLRGPGSGSTGDFTQWADWNRFPSQRSKTVTLEEGQSYYIEALLKEGWGADHVEVAWQIPGGEQELIPGEYLVSHLRDDDDLDGDYLPDSWESAHSLSTVDNGRNDGVREGEQGDFDDDGLTNWREYRLGTDPSKADSDGDGVSDWVEVEDYHSNPLIKDVAPPSEYLALDLKQRASQVGKWNNKYGLISEERRGEVTFDLTLADSGIYFAELVAEVISNSPHRMPLRFLIDGQVVASRDLIGEQGEEHTLSVRLPWLPAGAHQITVDSDNIWVGARLRIASLRILKPEGLDADSSGTADWMEGLLASRNEAEVPSSSKVSPLCLEGISTWVGNVQIRNHQNVLPISAGVDNGWFADIPLKRNGITAISTSFEGGLVAGDFSTQWTATNLLTEEAPIHLRKGDALKLTAFREGGDSSATSFQLFLDDELIHEGPSSSPHVHRFRKPGEYRFKAVVNDDSGTVETELSVFAYRAGFGKPLHVFSGESRSWKLPNVPGDVDLQVDQDLRAIDGANKNGVRLLTIGFPDLQQGERHVLARVPGDGTILARGTVKGFIFAQSSRSGDHEIVEVLEDGTRIVDVGYVLDGPIPPDFSIFLEMWVPDAVFEDGESTRILTAADFDENGMAKVRIIKAPGDAHSAVCHSFQLFEGNKVIRNRVKQ